MSDGECTRRPPRIDRETQNAEGPGRSPGSRRRRRGDVTALARPKPLPDPTKYNPCQRCHQAYPTVAVQPVGDPVAIEAQQRWPRSARHHELSTGEMHPPAQDRHCFEKYRCAHLISPTDTWWTPTAQAGACPPALESPVQINRFAFERGRPFGRNPPGQ